MSNIKHIITSDLHIGNDYCFRDDLKKFLEDLPPDAGLVLNGDTVDFYPRWTDKDRLLLDCLRAESSKREIIWVKGNHDRKYRLSDAPDIKHVKSHVIDGRVLITHGHSFEERKIHIKCLVPIFRFFYRLHMLCGAKSIHVAAYAKQFPGLYNNFREKVAENAVAAAAADKIVTVICGHTHYHEDRVINGVRYINTGSWTEKPFCYITVDDTLSVNLIN